MSPHAIEQALAAWQSARARLLAEDPALENDEAALIELLGPEDADVHAILARLLRAALHAEDMADQANGRASQIAARAKRYKARAEGLRGTAFAILEVTGERRFELPDLTASIRSGKPAVVITDEAALPDDLCRIERKPDKAAIALALQAGEVPGAMFSNGLPSLTIRSK